MSMASVSLFKTILRLLFQNMGNSRSMISVSFIGKHASFVVLRVEQQLRTMSVCYIENDASLPVVMRV